MLKDAKAFLDSERCRAVDLQEAKHIEVRLDSTGKFWLNVDNVCIVRIGKVQDCIIIDTPKARKEINL